MGSASYKCCAKHKHELMFERIVDFNSMIEFLEEEKERVKLILSSVNSTNFKIKTSEKNNNENLASNNNTDHQKYNYYSSLELVILKFLEILRNEEINSVTSSNKIFFLIKSEII
jgi:hypothetical protein